MVLLFLLQANVAAQESPSEKVSFNFQVKSILSENCFYCHGPDPNHRKAGLRLDTAEGSTAAIEAGYPDDSEMIARIFSSDPADQMPPPNSGRSITDREKEILRRWVKQGAQYETHWAYTKIDRPAVPEFKNKAWVRNAIDRFVLAKLESKAIAPSPRAEPQVLVRRLFLDLIGLPPSPKESKEFVEAYERDSEAAIDSLVDELMASPHYGERMALP